MADEADIALIKKYEECVYGRHADIEDIAIMTSQTEDQVWADLEYLDNKKLINGIILNEVDRKIVYYYVEKHKKEKDFISVNCQHCGALVDVRRGSKGRCNYCDTIIEDNVLEKALELLHIKEEKRAALGLDK